MMKKGDFNIKLFHNINVIMLILITDIKHIFNYITLKEMRAL